MINEYFGMNKRTYLQWMCNKYGDFKVATRFKDGNWSKHKSVIEIWYEGDFWRLDKATDRTQLLCEIVLDFDDGNVKQNLASAIVFCNERKWRYIAYKTGGKGFHLHIIIPELNIYDRRSVNQDIKKWLNYEFNAEIAKSSDHVMVLLEWEKHRKTKIQKTPIKWSKHYE